MGDNAAKGADQLKKAEKKLASWQIFGNKYEDAAELLEKAATNFKLAKLWDEAGGAFLKLAECHEQLEAKHDAASALTDAANSFKKTQPARAVQCLQRSVDAFVELGRLSLAAKHNKDMAELLEAEGDVQRAMFHFEQAAELYDGEEQTSTANTCKLKVAALAAQADLYVKAVEIFEAVALASLSNNLLKYSVKSYLLNAGLCQLCRNDPVALSNALDRYQEMDPTFIDTRECKLLQELAAATEEGDATAFTNVVAEFDAMSKLDAWKTRVLLTAKRLVTARENGGEDLC